MRAMSSKSRSTDSDESGYRFGSIAEIRHRTAASEILRKHGGQEGLNDVTAKILNKAKQVAKLRERLRDLQRDAERGSQTA